MVLPVSGFLPVPLPMMIPFMGAQSLVIGKMFGEGFQYGKRKISAMPNEEFNKLTFEAMMQNARSEIQRAIPTMEASMHDMQRMVETVINEFTDYLSKVIEKAPEQLAQIGSSVAAAGFAGPAGIATDIAIKTLGANPTQSQMLAYAKYLMQQAVQKPEFGKQPAFEKPRLSTVQKFHLQEMEKYQIRLRAQEKLKGKYKDVKGKFLPWQIGKIYRVTFKDFRGNNLTVTLTLNEHKLKIANLRKMNTGKYTSHISHYAAAHKMLTGVWI